MVGLEIGVGRFWSNWVHLVTVTFTQLLRALSIPKVRTARSDYGRSRTKHFGNETGFFQEKGGKGGGKEVEERSGKGDNEGRETQIGQNNILVGRFV